jgi:hypothetical protein
LAIKCVFKLLLLLLPFEAGFILYGNDNMIWSNDSDIVSSTMATEQFEQNAVEAWGIASVGHWHIPTASSMRFPLQSKHLSRVQVAQLLGQAE